MPEPITARLALVPCTLGDAHEYVRQHHRHHRPSRGGLFAVAVASDAVRSTSGRAVEDCGAIVGVAVIGRPVARGNQDGWTAEVTRLATDGTRNACSMLYRAAWRACRALGYRRLLTYTLASEPGTSLRAAGFREVARVTGRSWDCASRPRVDRPPHARKDSVGSRVRGA